MNILITNWSKALLVILALICEKNNAQDFNKITNHNGKKGYWHYNDRDSNPTKGGFVEQSAYVDEKAFIGPSAMVLDSASVEGRVRIYGNAIIKGEAIVKDEARVYGNAIISENAMVEENARVSGNAHIFGTAVVKGNAIIRGYVRMNVKEISSGVHTAKQSQREINNLNARKRAFYNNKVAQYRKELNELTRIMNSEECNFDDHSGIGAKNGIKTKMKSSKTNDFEITLVVEQISSQSRLVREAKFNLLKDFKKIDPQQHRYYNHGFFYFNRELVTSIQYYKSGHVDRRIANRSKLSYMAKTDRPGIAEKWNNLLRLAREIQNPKS